MLILFDIDGTLLRSSGVGPRSMCMALQELCPPRHEGDFVDPEKMDTAGSLDPLIWKTLLDHRGLDATDVGHDAFRETYGAILTKAIEEEDPVYALPGAAEAVAWVQEHPTLEAALLTGNYPETGRLKVKAAGFDPDLFRFGTWGSEADRRRGLPPIAMERARSMFEHAIEPHETVIVGDTPADVDCAHANGCRVIAVATGRFDVESLRPHEPDVLLPNLADLTRFQDAVAEALAAGPFEPRH
ncbi:MAG: HAD family hydrolase [Phycisphaerales bacterium]|nr:HAD family hydrolase [Phycisphaerales bacterium]